MKENDQKNLKQYFLAIECSGRVGSAALGRGPELLEEIIFSGKMRHSSELFPALTRLLDKAGCRPTDIGTLCFTVGPGSFTGLRIAVTTAKMLNFALKTQLVAVDTLDVIAENATEYIQQTGDTPDRIAPILDAKKNQFYTAVYKRTEDENWQKDLDDILIRSDLLIQKIEKNYAGSVTILGEGLLYHRDLFTTHNIRILPEEYWPARARNVLKIGYKAACNEHFSDPATLVPFYIRPPEAVEKWHTKG